MRLRMLCLFVLVLTAVTVGHAQTAFRARVGLRGYRDPIAIDTVASEYVVHTPPGRLERRIAQLIKNIIR